MAKDEKGNPPLEERDDVMIAALLRERDQIMHWPKPDTDRVRQIDEQLRARGHQGKLEQPKAPTPAAGQRTATQPQPR